MLTIVKWEVKRFLAYFAGLVTTIALWLLLPGVLTTVFNLNLVWVQQCWGAIYGYLPKEVVLPLEGVQQAYGGLVALLQALTKLLPAATASQTEAAARGILGEGWLFIAELSFLYRAAWSALDWWKR